MVNINKLIGLCLFSFTYLISLVQIYAIYNIEADSRLFFYYKIVFYFFASLGLLNHFMVSITDPGKITHNNNLKFLDFYTETRSKAILRAVEFEKNNKHMMKPPAEDEVEEDNDNSDIENDDNVYEDTKMSIDLIKDIQVKYNITLQKCMKCNIVQVPEVRHCYICMGYGLNNI
jgi:hypothetical protein